MPAEPDSRAELSSRQSGASVDPISLTEMQWAMALLRRFLKNSRKLSWSTLIRAVQKETHGTEEGANFEA